VEQVPKEQRRTFIPVSPEKLSIRRCCDLLGLNRSTLYYQKQATDGDNIDVLNAIREVWERYPFYGYRRITTELRANGIRVNRKRVQRLMAWGGIQALYPGPNTSRRNKRHAVHPYLLKGLSITRPNQVWMVDITYLRLPNGFMYLVALIDVYSRYIVSWSLSNSLDTDFCIEALKSGLSEAQPEIINSDQGCQFTSENWIHFLHEWHIKVSMTGPGRCLDNVYIERFWRSFKREEFYLNEYGSVKELKKAISAYIRFYNQKRWHQALDYKTPASVYLEPERKACG
jgi:putative transposase